MRNNNRRWWWAGASVALAMLPVANILWIVAVAGVDTLSNDYYLFTPLVDRILSGGYDWSHYFADTLLMNGSQSYALPFLLRLVAIRMAHWNVYVEMGIGVLLALGKLAVAYALLSRQASVTARRWLLPALSALIFSTAQINTFTNGETALQIGAIQIGMALSIWALAIESRPWWAAVLMALGGVVASLSGGGGLVIWPALLLGLLIQGRRRGWDYLAWGAGALFSVAPYAAYGFLRQALPAGAINFNFVLWVTHLGYPFANGTGEGLYHHTEAFWIGVGGLLFCLAGLLLVWQKGLPRRGRIVPAILFLSIGLFNAGQISLTRPALAPWYTSYSAFFWIGLVGLAAGAWPDKSSGEALTSGKQQYLAFNEMWSVALLLTIAALYLRSNLTYRDKAFYLASRSPGSAACLRNYRRAPTYCEGMVFQWGVGHPAFLAEFGAMLEKHRLSVFAPRQTWWLQGDFGLDSVTVSETAGVPDVFWVEGWSNRPTFWQDYHRLNLLLPAPNRVAWTLDLPKHLKSAVFRSAVAMDRFAPESQQADGLVFEVFLKPEGEERVLLFSQRLTPGEHAWQPIDLPLDAYRGQAVTLLFKARAGSNFVGDMPVLRAPRLELALGEPSPQEPVQVIPSNTELNPLTARLLEADRLVIAEEPGDWRVEGVETSGQSGERWMVLDQPRLALRQPVDLCMSEYTHFYVWLAASAEVDPRAARLDGEMYRLDAPYAYRNPVSVWVPLLADGAMHLYTYDLKLLQPSQNSRLTNLEFLPLLSGWESGVSWIQVGEAGFIASPEPVACQADSP